MLRRVAGPLLIAVIAHGALLLVTIHFDEREEPEVVRVRLKKPEPPEPEPPPPEPEPEPEPPPPEPEPLPEPAEPPPQQPPPPEPKQPPPKPPPEPPPPVKPPPPKPPPEDPRAQKPPPPKVEKPPPQPPPPKTKPSKPNMRGYGRGVHGSVHRERRYPVSARKLGLEGQGTVKLTIDRRGNLVGKPSIVRSTGHAVLDDEALRMVARAAPFPPLPAGFQKPQATIVIPVSFKLRGS